MTEKELIFIKENGFMRKCRGCGETAYTIEDLSKFNFKKGQLFERTIDCSICVNYARWKLRNSNKSREDYIKFLQKKERIKNKLRVCRCCGLEANTKEELSLFTKSKGKKHDTQTICLKCTNAKNIFRFKNNKKLLDRKRESANRYSKSVKGLVSSRIRCHNSRALKKFSTPKWISEEEINKMNKLHIQAFYLEKLTGTPYHVDHIYPSNHPLMCGLNILSNLQLLEGEINMSKNNSLGYLWQSNITELGAFVKTKTSKRKIFSMLGSTLTWEEFLVYEKLNYENLIYGK